MMIGFIGVGVMGGGMAQNLIAKGHRVMPFDLDATRLRALRDLGAEPAESVEHVVEACDIVLMSLPKPEVSLRVARQQILPAVRRGQVCCELGTVPLLAIREMAAAYAARGATLIDAPVSGGADGAVKGQLRVFASGDIAGFERLRPILQCVAAPDGLVYCGVSGQGQVVKAVNQLMMGLANAAYAEAIALGVRAGVPVDTLRKAIGDSGRWRKDFDAVAEQVAAASADAIDTKMHQVPMFLEEAAALGQCLPLTEALWDFCRDGEPCMIKFGQRVPSFWRELIKQDHPRQG